MTWTPLGPSLVLNPRYMDYRRLARANAFGHQCAVQSIAIHPTDERNILVVTQRVGGSSAFRTTDDGHSWSCVADTLTQANPQLELSCAAVHPLLTNVIYLGARRGQRIFVSIDGGLTWPQQRDPGGRVTQLIVDRNSGSDWHAATLYAGTSAGVAHSTDGGDTWTMAAIGEITSLAVFMPTSGPRQFYAGVYGRGLFYADSAAGPWQNLFGAATGLPAEPPTDANLVVLVDFSPRQPERVYALVSTLGNDHSAPNNQRLFVSTASPPAGAWEERGPGPQPFLDYYLEGLAFMVAPEPLGADTGDVLWCSGGVQPQRSTNGGRTWSPADVSAVHHVDVRALAHHPPKTRYYPDALGPTAMTPQARVYLGSDGGLGASRRYTDPTFDITLPPAGTNQFNSGPTYDGSMGWVENLNHGLTSVAAFQFASNPDPLAGGPMSTVGYLTTLDNGTSRWRGSLAWRETAGGDAGPIFVAPTGDGVRAWVNASEGIIWPVWNFVTWMDRDAGREDFAHVVTASANSCGATSNMMGGAGPSFYVGIIALEQVTTLLSPVVASNSEVEVVPVAMTADFIVGAEVSLNSIGPAYPISSVMADRFQVYVNGTASHGVGTGIWVIRSFVARVSGTTATPVSQIFPRSQRLYRLAKAGDTLLAASVDQRLWKLASASSAGSATVWTEISGRPATLSGASIDATSLGAAGEFVSGVEVQGATPLIAGLVADAAGTFYVMLSQPVGATLGGEEITTPLFRVEADAWVPEACTLPASPPVAAGVALGKVVSHPTAPGRLFVARNASVFQLERGLPEWTWTNLTDNLPGQEIHDLWIGNIAAEGATPHFVLRATTAVRGVWELDLDAPTISGARLYFRDHAFDPGWLGPSVDGVLSPLRAGERHWHWQSADIKVDTPLRDSSGALYYQNEPEAPTPTAGDFAVFKDRSQVAAAGTSARVWVRINNRSPLPAGPVNVWAITCLYSGALPVLPSGFWSRFAPDGSIDSSTSLGSDWTSLGVMPASNVSAEAPGVVGFEMPTGAEGDHRCIVVFVHGPGALLNASGLSLVVDEVVPAHTQIAQRNVAVSHALSPMPGTPSPTPGLPASQVEGTGADELGASYVQQYVEFHNPRQEAVLATIRFDLAFLPPALALNLRLSRNARPQSIAGAKRKRAGCLAWPRLLVSWLRWKLANLLGLSSSGKRLPLASATYETRAGGEVEVREIPLAPGSKVAAELLLRADERMAPGDVYHLDVLQLVKGAVVGGATIVVPIAGMKPAQAQLPNWDDEREIAGRSEMERRV